MKMTDGVSKKDPNVLTIGGVKISRGERKRVYLESAALYDFTQLKIPVEVIRGKTKGPVLFISACVHGDEVNGIAIIQKLLKRKFLKNLTGTLILVPIVNVFGFNYKSRYLPDRKDLNRSFPGSKNGSLASRLAYIFMEEIISKSTHGIDLHTGAIHRTNLPQIRACLDDESTKNLAESFGVPVVINSSIRDGSLREAARNENVAMLLFEGGEALRFESDIIQTGLRGCISVMKKIGMIKNSKDKSKNSKIFIAKTSYWTRAPHSGIFSVHKKMGKRIRIGDAIATISDPLGKESFPITAEEDGIIIGANLLPLVNQGDAMFHIAVFQNSTRVEQEIEKHDEIL